MTDPFHILARANLTRERAAALLIEAGDIESAKLLFPEPIPESAADRAMLAGAERVALDPEAARDGRRGRPC